MANYWDSMIDNVVDQVFNSMRTDSENADIIRDRLSQFGWPTDRDQDQALTYCITDAVARRRGSVIEQALRVAGATDPVQDGAPSWSAELSEEYTRARPAPPVGNTRWSPSEEVFLRIAEEGRIYSRTMAECGYYTSAAKLLESSIQTFRAFGDSYGVFAAVSELGTVYGLLGYDQASSGQPDLAFASFMQAKAYFFESMQLRFEAVAVDRMDIIRQNMMELAKSMLIAGE